MKRTISRKLTLRVALLLLLTLALLFVGSYHIVSGMVEDEMGHYTMAISGIYADMINQESSGMHIPIDSGFREVIEFYGDYICSWYRIDYAYMAAVDTEHNTLELLGMSQKEGAVEELPTSSEIGKVTEYVFSEEELAFLRGEELYFVSESTRFASSMDTAISVTDDFGNQIAAVVGVSLEKINQSIWEKFRIVALILLLVFVAITLALYFIIRKSVFRPARKISDAMTDFIRDGKRVGEKLDESGGDEFAMIAGAFNRMTDEIDDYVKNIQTLNREQDRQKTELDIAGSIQKGFLPAEKLSAPDYEIRAMMTPAKDIGGDLYDYLPLDEERTLITIADVSGKGLSASMYMAVTLMLLRQYALLGMEPAEILRNTNNALSDSNPRMLFVTAFVGIYNSRSGVFTYANAGHNLPYILQGRSIRRIEDGKNALLGIFRDEEYTQAETRLRTGDVLYLYTDGVNEATDESDAFYGMERLEQRLKTFRASHEESLTEYMQQDVRAFTGSAEQSDDITMLALTVKHRTQTELAPDPREFERVKQTILASALPRSLQLDLCVAAEEIFINICSYAFGETPPSEASIRFTFEHYDRVLIRFEDNGTAYDPTECVIAPEDYDIDGQIGGLGKLIAFSVTDEVHYACENGKNILTMIKYIQEEPS